MSEERPAFRVVAVDLCGHDDVYKRLLRHAGLGKTLFVVPFQQYEDLKKGLAELQRSRGARIPWLEIVAEGAESGIGPIDGCTYEDFALLLKAIMAPHGELYLSGCRTGVNPFAGPCIAQGIEDKSGVSVHGTVGVVTACALAEYPKRKITLVGATPMETSPGHLPTGEQVFRGFSPMKDPPMTCYPVNLCSDQGTELVSFSDRDKNTILEAIESGLRGEKVPTAEIRPRPDLELKIGRFSRVDIIGQAKFFRYDDGIFRLRLPKDLARKLLTFAARKP